MKGIQLQPGLFQGLEVFQGMGMREVSGLTSGCSLVKTKNREVLFAEGDSAEFFGIVASGHYKLTKRGPDGKNSLISIVTKDEVLAALIMPHPVPKYPITALSVGISTFLKIPRSIYVERWLSNPEMMRRVHMSAHHRLTSIHSLKAAQRMSLEAKIAGFVIVAMEKGQDEREPSSERASSGAGMVSLSFPISRKDIADALGASVESVVRIMSAWEQNGIISTSSQMIDVLDEEYLARLYCGTEERPLV